MNELEKAVIEEIGEDVDNPDVFLDTEDALAPIRDSINDAIQEIALITGGHKRTAFIPLRAGIGFYRVRFADGFLGWVVDARLVNNKRRMDQTDLIRLAAEDPRWQVSSGIPFDYFQIGTDVIGFRPKPSSNSDVAELTIVEIPGEYAHGSRDVKIRRDFKHAAIQFAVSEYWASRGDANTAQTHMDLYLATFGLQDRFTQSPQRQPRVESNEANIE